MKTEKMLLLKIRDIYREFVMYKDQPISLQVYLYDISNLFN